MILFNLVNAATAATFTVSPQMDLGDLLPFSIDIKVTGSNVTGTFTLECTNSLSDPRWTTVSNSSQAITTSQEVFYNIRYASYRYVRLAFSYTSGTGAITADAVIKQNLITGA